MKRYVCAGGSTWVFVTSQVSMDVSLTFVMVEGGRVQSD